MQREEVDKKIELSIQEAGDNLTKLRKTIADEFDIPSCMLITTVHEKEK